MSIPSAILCGATIGLALYAFALVIVRWPA
jgi:hypothetical protein